MTKETRIKLALDTYYEERSRLENASNDLTRGYDIFDDHYFKYKAELVEAVDKLDNRFIELITE